MVTISGAGTKTPKPGIYTINPRRSQVQFQIRHMFGLGPVHGTFGADRGEIVVAALCGERIRNLRCESQLESGAYALPHAPQTGRWCSSNH